MKTKMKALALALCAVMLVATTVFATLAYLTSTTEPVENTFTVGQVKIALDETDYDEDSDTDDQKTYVYTDTSRADTVRDTKNEYKLLPGITFPKDPTVHVEVGSEPSYIRMLVTITYAEAADALFAAKINEWIDLDLTEGAVWKPNGNPVTDKNEKTGIITRTYEFRYTKVVSTLDGAKEVTFDEYGRVLTETNLSLNSSSVTVDDQTINYFDLEDLFTEISVPDDLENEDLANLANLTIDVEAHAIQAAGFKDANEAWTAFDNQ